MKENESQWKLKCKALEEANSAAHIDRASALSQRDRHAATITTLREENKALRERILEAGETITKRGEECSGLRAILRSIGCAAGVSGADAPSTFSKKFEIAVIDAISRGRRPGAGESQCAKCHGVLQPIICRNCEPLDQAKGQQVDENISAPKPAETVMEMHGIGFADSAERSVRLIALECADCHRRGEVNSYLQAHDLGWRYDLTGRILCRRHPPNRAIDRNSYLAQLLDMRVELVNARRFAEKEHEDRRTFSTALLEVGVELTAEKNAHAVTRAELESRVLDAKRAARDISAEWVFNWPAIDRQIVIQVTGPIAPEKRHQLIAAIRRGFGNVVAPTKIEIESPISGAFKALFDADPSIKAPGILPPRGVFEHHVWPKADPGAGNVFPFMIGFDCAKGKDETIFQIVSSSSDGKPQTVREFTRDPRGFNIKTNADGSLDIDLVFRTEPAPMPKFEVKLMNDIASYGRPGAAKPDEAAEKIDYCVCTVEEVREFGVSREKGEKFVKCEGCLLPLHPKKEALMRKVIFRVR